MWTNQTKLSNPHQRLLPFTSLLLIISNLHKKTEQLESIIIEISCSILKENHSPFFGQHELNSSYMYLSRKHIFLIVSGSPGQAEIMNAVFLASVGFTGASNSFTSRHLHEDTKSRFQYCLFQYLHLPHHHSFEFFHHASRVNVFSIYISNSCASYSSLFLIFS